MQGLSWFMRRLWGGSGMVCLSCGKEIGDINKNIICPYCGFEQYKKPKKSDMILVDNFFRKTKKRKEKQSNKKNDEINQWFDMGLF